MEDLTLVGGVGVPGSHPFGWTGSGSAAAVVQIGLNWKLRQIEVDLLQACSVRFEFEQKIVQGLLFLIGHKRWQAIDVSPGHPDGGRIFNEMGVSVPRIFVKVGNLIVKRGLDLRGGRLKMWSGLGCRPACP